MTSLSHRVAAGGRVIDYLLLLKPRVMTLVVFTGVAGLIAAPGDLHPLLALIVVLCVALGAGGAGAINMWYDADMDARMARTSNRPIPAGRVAPHAALELGVILCLLSVMILGLAVNWLAAGLLAFACFFYAVVYTMGLKRRTAQNIVIGGAAGAMPPVIAWAAVTGGLDWAPWVLFAIIFFWTPPHFWALALVRADEYARAGVPMLPVVAGVRATQWQMFFYTLVLVPVVLAPWLMGFAGMLYALVAGVVSALFIACAIDVLTSRRLPVAAMRMFAFSILHLSLIFAALLLEHMLGIAP